MATLKLKVVAVSVFSGVVSTMGVLHMTLGVAADKLSIQVLEHEGDYAETTAAMLGDKLQMLQSALQLNSRGPLLQRMRPPPGRDARHPQPERHGLKR